MVDREQLKSVVFFQNLPEATHATLAKSARLRVLQPNDSIWRESDCGDAFAFVVKGQAKLSKSCQGGRDSTLEIVGEGELLCGGAISTESAYCCSCSAIEDGTQVVLIPREVVRDLCQQQGEFAWDFAQELTRRCAGMCTRVVELSAGQVERRLAALLVKLADRTGVQRDDGVRVPVPLSRQDLADLCGTSIETTARVMSRWRKSKLVRSAARGFLITDLNRLREIVSDESRRR